MNDYAVAEYTLKFLEATDFKDNYQNTWCNAAFEGISEPVTWVLKDPSTVKEGEKYYGEIKVTTAKSGRNYLRFKRLEQPEGGAEPIKNIAKGSAYSEDPDKQTSIYRSVALNCAAAVFQGSGESASRILDLADAFDEWLNKTPQKASEEPKSLKEQWNNRKDYTFSEKDMPFFDENE